MDSTKRQQSLGPVEREGLKKCPVCCAQASDKSLLLVLNKTKPGLGKLTSAPWGSPVPAPVSGGVGRGGKAPATQGVLERTKSNGFLMPLKCLEPPTEVMACRNYRVLGCWVFLLGGGGGCGKRILMLIDAPQDSWLSPSLY